MARNGYSKRFPWQMLTKKRNIQLSCKLDTSFDVDLLQRDLQTILDKYAFKMHFSSEHDGGWSGIGLIAAGGDYKQDAKVDGDYEPTEVLAAVPYMQEVIQSFDCATKRVRVLRLEREKNIFWHYDDDECLDFGNARIHIPIQTHRDVQFQISHEDEWWAPGEAWYGDFSFPHRLYNGSPVDRYHLVVDLLVDDRARGLFPDALASADEKRARTRRSVWRLLDWTYTKPGKLVKNPGLVFRKARRLVSRRGA